MGGTVPEPTLVCRVRLRLAVWGWEYLEAAFANEFGFDMDVL